MPVVISRDGTRIGYDKAGQGPPVVLVDGAMCYRASGPMKPLAKLLAPHFTVYTYDRRGRGESGDTQPWSVKREVEDIAALVRDAGEPVFVYGISSGAVLALEAADGGVPIRKLALYEAPLMVDASRPPLGDDFLPRLQGLIAENRRGEAVKMFMKAVGVPAIGIFVMRLMPVWKKLTAIGHTLQYDLGMTTPYQQGRPLPAGHWPGASMPALVMDGGKSPAWMRNAQAAIAHVLPRATARTLPGQNHMVTAEAIAPSLIEFFG
jgi:pimeloyl-ACP methyl ester carboxylesterase